MYSHSDRVIKTKIKVATHKIINVGSYHHQAMHTGEKIISKRAFTLSFMNSRFIEGWTVLTETIVLGHENKFSYFRKDFTPLSIAYQGFFVCPVS